jgi:hypothetical protein
VKNAHFLIHHAYETENKNRAPVDRERVGCSAEEILSKVVCGRKAHPRLIIVRRLVVVDTKLELVCASRIPSSSIVKICVHTFRGSIMEEGSWSRSNITRYNTGEL